MDGEIVFLSSENGRGEEGKQIEKTQFWKIEKNVKTIREE